MSINEEINLDTINVDATISTGIDVSSVGVGGPRGEKGDKGDRGDTGATGPANTLTIGTVAKGDEAAATITGTAPNQTLNLTLPKGDKGDTGNTGPANSLSIGTVESGSTAAATITGTAPDQTLNLTLPKGDKGDTGAAGANGVSPTVTTSKSGKVTTITITDVNGVHTATVNDGADGPGTGDMLKATYDTNENGIVDNAEKVNNHTVETDVPANAVFTDTTYTAGIGIDITNNVISTTGEDITVEGYTGLNNSYGVVGLRNYDEQYRNDGVFTMSFNEYGLNLSSVTTDPTTGQTTEQVQFQTMPYMGSSSTLQVPYAYCTSVSYPGNNAKLNVSANMYSMENEQNMVLFANVPTSLLSSDKNLILSVTTEDHNTDDGELYITKDGIPTQMKGKDLDNYATYFLTRGTMSESGTTKTIWAVNSWGSAGCTGLRYYDFVTQFGFNPGANGYYQEVTITQAQFEAFANFIDNLNWETSRIVFSLTNVVEQDFTVNGRISFSSYEKAVQSGTGEYYRLETSLTYIVVGHDIANQEYFAGLYRAS